MKFGEIPVIILPKDYVLSEDHDLLYIVAGNGNFVLKNQQLLRSLTKVNEISHLPKLQPFGEMKIPKIYKDLLAQGLKFFKQIYETYKSEAGIRIFYNPYTEFYLFDVPNQKISGTSTDWKNSSPPKDFMYVGTLHSHGGAMSAFHSGTDKGSEGELDGIHIVFGHINTDTPSVTAAIVINGNRFQLKEEEILRYLDIVITNREEIKYVSSGVVWEDYAASKVSTHNMMDVTAQPIATKFHFSLDVDMDTVEIPIEWYENMIYTPDVVYKFVGGKLIKCSLSSNTAYIPSETKYLPSPAAIPKYSPTSPISRPDCYGSDDIDYYPMIDYTICPKCHYREIAIKAMEDGLIDELLLTTMGCYGEHTSNNNRDFELSYDSNGNMIDSEGVIIMTKEEVSSYESVD